jgi:hypothetical protein
MKTLLLLLCSASALFAQSAAVLLFGGATAPDTRPLLSNNLIAYWSFDETSGSRADSVGTNTLTAVNTPPSTNGLQGNALLTTRSGNRYVTGVNSSNSLPLFTYTNWSMSWWQKSLNADASGISGVWGDASANDRFMFQLYPTAYSNVNFQINVFNGTSVTALGSTNLGIINSNWNQITLQYTGTNTQVWTNSVLAFTFNSALNIVTNRTPGIAFGGRYVNGSPTSFETAVFDEYAVFNRCLASNELSWLFNAGSGRALSAFR